MIHISENRVNHILNSIFFNKITKNSKIEILFFWIFVLFIGVLLYQMNVHTPLVVDDLGKSDVVRPFQNGSDYIKSIYHFYFNWGGRIWGELYSLLFLSIPKSVFNIINTIGYLLTVFLIYINITGKLKISIPIFMFINFSLFAFLPAFGQDILWISGTANYMWASIIPLLLLALWRIYSVKKYHIYDSGWFGVLLFILGIFSGWANENVSVAIVGLLLLYMLSFKNRDKQIPWFSYWSMAGTVLGSLLLWLAPGNFVRYAAENHTTSIIRIMTNSIHNVVQLLRFESGLTLFIGILCLFLLGKCRNKSIAGYYVIAAIIGAVAMGVVGHLNTRTFFGCIVFLIIAAGILYDTWDYSFEVKKARFFITILLIFGIGGFYSTAKNGILDFQKRWDANIQIIHYEKEKGNLDVVVNPITPLNRFCANFGLDDIKPKEKNQHWLNKSVATYYGLHSIQSAEIKNK